MEKQFGKRFINLTSCSVGLWDGMALRSSPGKRRCFRSFIGLGNGENQGKWRTTGLHEGKNPTLVIVLKEQKQVIKGGE